MYSKFALLAACLGVASATWKEVTTLDIVALDLKCSSTKDCYISGGVNGQAGIVLLSSKDAGATWNQTAVTSGGFPLSLSIAVNPPHILVSGLFTQFISHDDGKTFKETVGDHCGQSMWATYEGGRFFAVGSGLWGNGVIVSSDNGAVFKGYNISVLHEGSFPRFLSAPSETTWYVSAGAQPQEVDDDTPADDDPPSAQVAYGRRLKHTTGGNVAQMVKTTDGGQTWTSQFYSTGQFYFMDIACADVNTCCVLSEADQDAPVLGVGIHCTTDGKTWTQMYNDTTPGTSLMDIAYQGSNNWVASGTFIDDGGPRATFVRSTDNGKTWTPDSVTSTPEVAVVAAAFPTPSAGFALGIDRFNSEMFLAYTA